MEDNQHHSMNPLLHNNALPPKQVTILGSTGSIGTQTLDVIRSYPERFEVYALSAQSQWELLVQQALEFRPDVVVIGNEQFYQPLKEALAHLPIKVWAGAEAIAEVAGASPADIVLVALVGYAGVKPTIHALKARKVVALANKESLVVAGELICSLALTHNAPILPVDSEHSAIFQCLNGEHSPVEKILLTASGGPFRGMSPIELAEVSPAQALSHPNWDMGAKVSIDSASLMNKGLEMIEAKWLFDLSPEQIEVIVHPQSIVHSMVQFADSSVMAQLSVPDMRLPIQYALTYPHRIPSSLPRLSLDMLKNLTFEAPDRKTFRNLDFAYYSIRRGGNMPCIMNAANEVAVEKFLKQKIRFTDIPRVIEETMNKASFVSSPSYEDYVSSNIESQKIAQEVAQLFTQ